MTSAAERMAFLVNLTSKQGFCFAHDSVGQHGWHGGKKPRHPRSLESGDSRALHNHRAHLRCPETLA